MPLAQFIREDKPVRSSAKLGIEKPRDVVEQLGSRWQGGKTDDLPADTSLQAKEVPLDVFFHKGRDVAQQTCAVLEQKINSHEKLSDAEKVEFQQYITRCYGSLTTFNILFKNKADQFKGGERAEPEGSTSEHPSSRNADRAVVFQHSKLHFLGTEATGGAQGGIQFVMRDLFPGQHVFE